MVKATTPVEMAQPPPWSQWTPAASHFVQHQLAHVSNFWKLGLPAELHLVSQEGGTAELKLSFSLPAHDEPIPPPSGAPNTSASSLSGSECLKKASPSRLRRRATRAAARAAVALKKFDAEEVSEEKSAEKATAEKTDTGNAVVTENVEVADESTSAERAKAERVGAKCDAEVDGSDQVATTSCTASKVQCWNCSGEMTPNHQCEMNTLSSLKADIVIEEPPPLPLCHYCCHRGSGEHPVHYFMQCMCNDSECSCVCYCTDEQLQHKKLFYPGGFGGKEPVAPDKRAAAKSVADARTGELRKHNECTIQTCVK